MIITTCVMISDPLLCCCPVDTFGRTGCASRVRYTIWQSKCTRTRSTPMLLGHRYAVGSTQTTTLPPSSACCLSSTEATRSSLKLWLSACGTWLMEQTCHGAAKRHKRQHTMTFLLPKRYVFMEPGLFFFCHFENTDSYMCSTSPTQHDIHVYICHYMHTCQYVHACMSTLNLVTYTNF